MTTPIEQGANLPSGNEEWIRVNDVPLHVPGNPCRFTIHKWIKDGVRGRKLASRMFGGRQYVHRDELKRFLGLDAQEPKSESNR